VIGTNKKDAADTVSKIVEDSETGKLGEPADHDGQRIEVWLSERAPQSVTWSGWQAIDEHERGLGEPHGRPRVKLVRVSELVAASRSANNSA